MKDVEIEFRPELSHEEQAEANFADLLRSCKARQKSAQREIDLIHHQEIEHVAQELEKTDDHPPAGENSAEAETKSKKQSAAKPRFLLPKFVDASIDPNMSSSEEDEGIPFESAKSQPSEPYPDSMAQADKRVHWQDEDTDDIVEKQAISTETVEEHQALEFDTEIHTSRNSRNKASRNETKTPGSTASEKGRRRKHDHEEDKLALLKKVQSGRGQSENKRRRVAHSQSDEGSKKSVSSKTSKKKASKASGEASSVATSVASRKSKSKHSSRNFVSSNKTTSNPTQNDELTTTKSHKNGSKPESKSRTPSSLRAPSSSRSVAERLGGSVAKHKESSRKKSEHGASSMTATTSDSKSSEKAKKQASLKLALNGSSASKKRGSSASKEHSSHSKKKARVAPTEKPLQKPSSKSKRPPIRRRRVGTTDSAKSSRSLKDISFTFG